MLVAGLNDDDTMVCAEAGPPIPTEKKVANDKIAAICRKMR
jgi:hypothetical protein